MDFASFNIFNKSHAQCPECKSKVLFISYKIKQYYACPKCNTFSKYNYDTDIYEKEAIFAYPPKPFLKLGTKILHKGDEYALISSSTANFKNEYNTWREYYFFSELKNKYVVIVNAYYQWQIYDNDYVESDFEYKGNRWYYKNKQLTCTDTYTVEYIAAEGQYDWVITKTGGFKSYEYKTRSLLFVFEDDEWFIGQNISHAKLVEKFPNKELSNKLLKKYIDPDHKLNPFSDGFGWMYFKVGECKLNSVCSFSVIQIYIFLESTPKCFLEYCSKSVKGGGGTKPFIYP